MQACAAGYALTYATTLKVQFVSSPTVQLITSQHGQHRKHPSSVASLLSPSNGFICRNLHFYKLLFSMSYFDKEMF
jgi:hypothetical protein